MSEKNFDGKKAVADMLTAMDEETRKRILGEIRERAPELIPELERRMFIFEDLVRYSDQEIQLLLREVSRERLALALRTASKTIQEVFFRNMSIRAQDLLREEMQAQGPRRLSEVEAAQREMVRIAESKIGTR